MKTFKNYSLKLLGFFGLILLSSIAFSQIERPKLVVGIVVDQMRAEYLYRYNADFGENGFKKLMRDGFNQKNTHYNYMPTYTAPGHASIYTGTTPAIHGIVGNGWYHKSEKKYVYCTADEKVMGVGIDPNHNDGKMSPWRLFSTTITDELKLATNNQAKVIGISLKDRGSILPAGHFADAAYWMDEMGNYISSSFYMNDLPTWVKNYNNKKMAQKYIDQGWNLINPMAEYNESIADDNDYERIFEPKKRPVFPYNLKEIAENDGDLEMIKTTPYGNDMVYELGKEAIIHENLGKDKITDFLALSFSSPDYVGHSFGPRSVELQDTYLRLDKNIADLIKFLDEKVGKNQYLIFLTADHAVAENPAFLMNRKYPVKRMIAEETVKDVKEMVINNYGEEIFVNYSNQNLFLNEQLILEKELDYHKIADEIKHLLMQLPEVFRVYTREEILHAGNADYHLDLIAQGYDPKQNGDLVIVYHPQFMETYPTGTTHGSTYVYDTHVPNLWYGWNINPGESYEKTNITQIAPTVSHLLNIQIPNGSQGIPILELLKSR